MANDTDLLARFPGPLALTPSRGKWFVVMLVGLAFTATGLFLMPRNEMMTWFCVIFFGFVAAVAIIMLIPGAGGLTLNRDGFEVTSLFRSHFVTWADATDFLAGRIPPAAKKMVLYNHAGAKNSTLGKLNAGLVGRNGAIPDTYGMSADALASLLAQWRERAVAPR